MNRQGNDQPKHKALLLASHARQRRLSDEEQALWAKITAGIQPLKGRDGRQPPLPPNRQQPVDAKQKPPSQINPTPRPRPAEHFPPLRHGDSDGVDKNTARRLRRGQMDVEATLDLHGLTQDSAFRALRAFVESSFRLGRRCVRIVTGKGLKGEGVLRAATPQWLNDVSLRPMILSFSHAQPKDGGEGALYVLLRRRR